MFRSWDTGDTWGGIAPHFFAYQKEKRETKEKRKNFKAETIKSLSPRSQCYCFSHSRVSRIQRFFLSVLHGGWQYFPVFHGPSTLKSSSPVLLCCCYWHSPINIYRAFFNSTLKGFTSLPWDWTLPLSRVVIRLL